VNTTYDEAAGRHVVTVDGEPFVAVLGPKGLNIRVDIVDGNPSVEVSGGLHEVVPLLKSRPPPGDILKQRARYATSSRQRRETAELGAPKRYLGKLERSLLSFEQGLKSIPGARSGVSFAQAGIPFTETGWREDILGNEVDRWEAIKEGTIAFAGDLFAVLEPEDLVELGSGKAAAGTGRAIEEGVAASSELRQGVARRHCP
jgi:hypothetical protein